MRLIEHWNLDAGSVVDRATTSTPSKPSLTRRYEQITSVFLTIVMHPTSTDPIGFIPPIPTLADSQPVRPLSPTLLIGIGRAGYAVLANLKKQVLDDSQDRMPDSLQLLWIGYSEHAKVDPGLAELEEHEQILLEPQLERAARVVNQNPELYTYLSWWTPSHRNNRRSRGNGRFSLFWMMQFENQAQRLYDALRHANIKLGGNAEARYRVFLVTNLFEPVSAILIDLANLVRQALPPQKVKFLIPMLLLNDDDETVSAEQRAGVIAALRELERFNTGREQLLIAGGIGRSVLTEPFLFDHLMAFDRPNVQVDVADLFIALLKNEIADRFDESLVTRSGMETAGQLLFSNASIFTYYLPIAEIRRVCAAKLLQDELFSGSRNSSEPGLLAQFPQVAVGTGRQDDFLNLAKSFLRDDRGQFNSSAFPLDLLAQAYDRQWTVAPFQTPGFSDLTGMLQTRLATYLNQMMYAERSRPLALRPYGTLGCALEFLKALRKIINEASLFLDHQRAHAVARDLRTQLPHLRALLEAWMREVERWQKAIDQIRLWVHQNVLSEQANLQKSTQDSVVRKIPFPRTNGGVNGADIGQLYYQKFMDQPRGINARTSIRARTGWFWNIHGNPEKTRLHWLVFGPADSLENWQSALHGHLPDELENAFFRLRAIAEFYTRQIGKDETIIDLLRETSSSQIVQPFKTPHFLLDTLPVPAPFRATDYYLAGPNQTQIIEWVARNRLVELSQRTIQIDDPTRFLYLVIDRNLPKLSLSILAKFQPQYYRDPGLHVFPEEQGAVQLEREYGLTETLHPRLVRLMGDLETFKLAIQLVLYGWVHEEFDGLRRGWVINGPGLPSPIPLEDDNFPSPNTLESALAMFLLFIPNSSLNSAHPLFPGEGRRASTMKSLRAACNIYNESVRQMNTQDKQALLDGYQRQIETWLNSTDDFLHSLGLLLKSFSARENL